MRTVAAVVVLAVGVMGVGETAEVLTVTIGDTRLSRTERIEGKVAVRIEGRYGDFVVGDSCGGACAARMYLDEVHGLAVVKMTDVLIRFEPRGGISAGSLVMKVEAGAARLGGPGKASATIDLEGCFSRQGGWPLVDSVSVAVWAPSQTQEERPWSHRVDGAATACFRYNPAEMEDCRDCGPLGGASIAFTFTRPGDTFRTTSGSSASAPRAPAVLYRPPRRGAPSGRVGGGTRGAGREVFVLSVLAPDHTGLTVAGQPTFYWYISSSTSLPMEITVTDPRSTQPVLEARVPEPVAPGVHRLRLADHGIRLSAGVEYSWSVAVVPDPDHRARDIVAGGRIEIVDPPAGLRERLARAGEAERAAIFADAGLWYDAVAAISERIDAAPDDSVLRRERAHLMAQVGLPEIVEESVAGTPRR